MAKLLKLRRGTTTQHGSFTGAEGEVTVDTDKETLVVHDGSTAGGHPVAAEDLANVSSSTIAGRLANDSIAVGKIAGGTLPSDVKIQDANVSGNLTIESADIVDGTIVNADINGSAAIGLSKLATGALPSGITVASANIVDGTIVNSDVNASAAISGTKVSPNFGSQSIVTTGNLVFSDSSSGSNNRVAFGNSGDLQVWHDGSNSYIADEGTGALRILGSAVQIKNPANNEIGLEFTENGSVDLYHDGSKKLETNSTGVEVSGHIDLDDDYSLRLGNSQDLLIYHNGSHSIINDNGTGDLQLVTNQGTKITLQGGSDTMANFIKDGSVELYFNNSKKFETNNTGASLSGNLDVSNGVDVTGNLTVSGTVNSGSQTVTGNITVSGTVDGVDVAALNTTVGNLGISGGTIASGTTAVTQGQSANNTQIATTAFVQTAVSNLVDSSPSALNTLNELAAAINDDANFSTTITNSIATKMPLAGGTFTGAVTGTTFADSKGDVRSIPLNSKSSSYTLTLADAGKAIYISSGGVTIPSSVMAAGNAVTIVNDSGSNQTITQGSGLTLYNTADAATGNRTLLPRGITTVWFAATATAYISGSGLE